VVKRGGEFNTPAQHKWHNEHLTKEGKEQLQKIAEIEITFTAEVSLF
jgi:hypothetical protein